jgi:hypothetical protein
LPRRGRSDFQPVALASLTPLGWVIDAPFAVLGFIVSVYAVVTGDGQVLPLSVFWTAMFSFATWYCWNIDPHYYSRPRRR